MNRDISRPIRERPSRPTRTTGPHDGDEMTFQHGRGASLGATERDRQRAQGVHTMRTLCVMRMALTVSLLLLVDAAARAQAPPGPLAAVSVVTVRLEDVARNAEFIGRVEAIQQVDVRARVQGFLEKV